MSTVSSQYKGCCGKVFYTTGVETTSTVSTVREKPVEVTPKRLVELGVSSSLKGAYNTLVYLARKGKAKKIRRGVYLLYPGSNTYEKVKHSLSSQLNAEPSTGLVGVGGGVGFGGGRWWRWRVVLFLVLRDGGVSPGFVARVFGVGVKSAWWLLERLRRRGLLRRVGRGWYVAGFVFGFTRVDSGGVVVSNRSVLGGRVHHPVLGLRLWRFVDPGRGGSVQVAFAFPGRFSGRAKFVAVYSYRYGGRTWWKVEPTVKARPGDPVEAVLSGLSAVGELYSALKPLGEVLVSP